VLRFERRLAHSPAKVWRAVTDPAEAVHWFPAAIETEFEVGARMRFTFPDEAPIDANSEGEILEFDPPKVYAFRWNTDVLRFELVPDGSGCLLVLTQTIGGDGWAQRLTAGRNAAGWDVCLDALSARLDDRPFEEPQEWLGPIEHYVEKFGLGEGEVLDSEELPALEMPYGFFRPGNVVRRCMDAWLRLGGPHHQVLNPGLQADAWRVFSDLAGLEFVQA
jgi:uncharacterized protein YndB with AHSA1/START domain